MGKQREKNRFAIDKNQPYEYIVAIIIIDELCNEGIIDIFDMAETLIKLKEELCEKGVIDVFKMTETIILLRKKYKMPVISIYGKKDNISVINYRRVFALFKDKFNGLIETRAIYYFEFCLFNIFSAIPIKA